MKLLRHRIFGKFTFVRWWNHEETCYALGREYSRTLVVRTLCAMAFIGLLSLAPAARAQSTNVVGSHVQSNIGGTLLAKGKVCFFPTDQNDQLVTVNGLGGIISASNPACGAIASGVVDAGFVVADSALTNPAGIYYRIEITDLCATCRTHDQVITRLSKVANVKGATWSLDAYVPSGVIVPPASLYFDMTETVAPGNPNSGIERWFANSSTHLLACLTSAGANCNPAAGGGSGTVTSVGLVLPSIFNVTVSPITTNGSLTATFNNFAANSFLGNNTASPAAPAVVTVKTTNLADFNATTPSASGKIPIWDQPSQTYIPGDPLVQGLFADGSTSAANPVAIGGYDTAGTPALHRAVELNGNPAGTEYGIVTRPIPSGTQGVSGTVTANAGTGTFNIQANASVNETQVAGAAIDVNSGNKSAGTQRMVLATDQPQLANALKVDGSAVTQPVSGTVTVTQATGTNLHTVCDSGCSSSAGFSDNATFTTGTTAINPAGGLFDDTPPTAVATGKAAAARITNNRALHVNLRNQAGTEIGTSSTPVQVSLANTAANATAVKVDGSAVTQPVSGTVTANAGAGTFNIQANASVNETQVAGTAIDVNSGTKSAGTQRVVLATDQPQLTNALKVDGSAVTQPVSGTVTANAGTGTFNIQANASVNVAQVAGNAVAADANGRQILKTYPDTTTPSYYASGIVASAASATDISVLAGNATNTVLVTRVQVTCTQTTAGIVTLKLIRRSTADTSGTSSSTTIGKDDTNFGAASSAAPLLYTANPTTGTTDSTIDTISLGCMAGGTATPNDIYIYRPLKPLVLRGTTQQLAVNLNGATVTGGSFNVTYNWEETTTP